MLSTSGTLASNLSHGFFLDVLPRARITVWVGTTNGPGQTGFFASDVESFTIDRRFEAERGIG
jgi:hypothetical protein